MTRKELVSRTAAALKELNRRKPVSIPKHTFHISDDDGNSKDFYVKKTDKSVLYTAEDVEAILDTMIHVIMDAIKQGEEINVHGFGRLALKYMKPKKLRNVLDGEYMQIDGFYLPRFSPGNDLRRCGQIYAQSLIDMELNRPLPIFSEIGWDSGAGSEAELEAMRPEEEEAEDEFDADEVTLDGDGE